MKVFVIMDDQGYDGQELIRVVSTRELAEEVVNRDKAKSVGGHSNYVIEEMEVEDRLEPFAKPYLVTLYDVQAYNYDKKILVHQFERLVKSKEDAESMCLESTFWVVNTDRGQAINNVKFQLQLIGRNPDQYTVENWNPRG